MAHSFQCVFHKIFRRIRDSLSPRAFAWRYFQRRHRDRSIITRLDKNLKVRIYFHDIIGKQIYIHRLFEPAECRLVMKFLKPGMIVVDAGANLGQYALLAARQVGTGGQVHSFEPSSRMFEELQFNVNLNGLASICTCNQQALSNTCGTAQLSQYEPGAEVFGSLGTQQRDNKIILGYETVETTTLDIYVQKKNVIHIDLIKIDIEGAELLALQGAKQILSKPNAPAILIEMADINTLGLGYHAVEIWDWLESFGYCFYGFDKHGEITRRVRRPSDFLRAQNLLAMKENGV